MIILNILKVPKNVKGENPLRWFNISSVANYQKNLSGPFGEIYKFSKKISQFRKKSKGDPLVSS